jgi:hypothetical protein
VSNKDVKQDALDNLADALTEDILNTPDDELLGEVQEDYGDPRALANKFEKILERAEKQAFRTARSEVRSSFLGLPYRLLEWSSTLFGKLRPAPAMVWVAAAAVLIALILAPAVFRSMSEFDERSERLAALEKEQLARSERIAALQKELLARSEQLAAREKELLGKSDVLSMQTSAVPETPEVEGLPQAEARVTETKPTRLCDTSITEPATAIGGIELPPLHICSDADLAFWQNLVSEIYQHKWRQLDANGQKRLRQGQLDWLGKLRNDCNAAFQVPVSGTEMARAKSCVLQSIKGRVAVLSNN